MCASLSVMQADEPKASDGPIMRATARISTMRVVIANDDMLSGGEMVSWVTLFYLVRRPSSFCLFGIRHLMDWGKSNFCLLPSPVCLVRYRLKRYTHPPPIDR